MLSTRSFINCLLDSYDSFFKSTFSASKNSCHTSTLRLLASLTMVERFGLLLPPSISAMLFKPDISASFSCVRCCAFLYRLTLEIKSSFVSSFSLAHSESFVSSSEAFLSLRPLAPSSWTALSILRFLCSSSKKRLS